MPNFFNKYPYTDFHELNLDWVLEKMHELIAEWASTLTEWHNTQEEFNDLRDYVNSYFDNLDVQAEINVKLNEMASDGSLSLLISPFVASGLPSVVSTQIDGAVAGQIDGAVAGQIGPAVSSQVGPYIAPAVTQWLDDNVTPVGSAVVVDPTLTISGAAADAQVTGDNFTGFFNTLERTQNIWNELWDIGVIASDGSINPNPSPSQLVTRDYIAVDPSTTYFAVTPSGHSIRVAEYDSSKTFIAFNGYNANQTFTTGATTAYIKFNTAGPALSDYDHDISVNILDGDYTRYYPYFTASDVYARMKLDDIIGPTPNLWNEEWHGGKYLDASGNEAVAGTPAYCTADFIAVDPSSVYYIAIDEVNASCRIAQYDSSKLFIGYIGYVGNNYFTTSATTAYIKFWKGGSNSYDHGVAIYTYASTFKQYVPHESVNDYVARYLAERSTANYIVVGPGLDITSVVAGFAKALQEDKGCIIMPGTYDLLAEGATGIGIIAPKHVIGYGAKLVAALPGEDWSFSAVNFSTSLRECIIEGLEIEVTNCRYCIHDEEYNNPDYYHHVIKNCTLIHNSATSATLIRPICIGGGFGNRCLVEIENCEFTSHDILNQDVNYHANSLGQTGDCIVKCKDSVFMTSIGISGNALTGFHNTMYVTNCLVGMLPADPAIANSSLIGWNNTVR